MVKAPYTRYSCPLEWCWWHHDESDVPEDLAAAVMELTRADVEAARAALGPADDAMHELTRALHRKSVRRVEAELWGHFKSHHVQEWASESTRLMIQLAQLGWKPAEGQGPAKPGEGDDQGGQVLDGRSLREWVLEVVWLRAQLEGLTDPLPAAGPSSAGRGGAGA